jgi:hypothetical protein
MPEMSGNVQQVPADSGDVQQPPVNVGNGGKIHAELKGTKGNLTKDVAKSATSVQPKPHPVKDLLTFHEEAFRAATGNQPAKYTAGDAKHAKDLIARHGPERARLIVRQAFVTTDEFIRKSGRSMGLIVSSNIQNKLIAELSKKPPVVTVSPSDTMAKIAEMEAKRNAR